MSVFLCLLRISFWYVGIVKAVGISAHRFVLFIVFNQKQLSFIDGYLRSLTGQDLIADTVLVSAVDLGILQRIFGVFYRDAFCYACNID